MQKKKIALGVIALVVIVVGALVARAQSTAADEVADNTVKAADPGYDKTAAVRGAAVARQADCIACHTAAHGGVPMAGGLGIGTPFGKIVATNITPDRETGIGNWTERDFFKAVRHGQSPGGHLYPAMPYNAYVKISDQDMHDLWAFMRSVPAAHQASEPSQLRFPYNVRTLMVGWNLLFFDNQPFQPDSKRSASWNRGQYLVEGAGHCASCHTGKNALGGDLSAALQGGTLGDDYAPEITGDPHLGLGSWSRQQVVDYLHQGSNGISMASGAMGEVVANSTQHMDPKDLDAIAEYLKSLPGSGTKAPAAVAAADSTMVRGARVYEANCSACHGVGGEGIDGMATRLADNPLMRSPDARTLIRTVLAGGRSVSTEGNITGAGMPSFDWKLQDDDIAAALTYVRNSWGNAAPPVAVDQVSALRRSTEARQPIPSAEAR